MRNGGVLQLPGTGRRTQRSQLFDVGQIDAVASFR